MANKTSLRKIGTSLGVIVPKAEIERLHLQEGDELYLVETPDGMELTPYDPEFEAQLKRSQKLMRKYRNTLHELAK